VDPFRKDTCDLPMPPKFSSDTNSSNFDILSSNNTVKTFEITPLKGTSDGQLVTLHEILTLSEPHQVASLEEVLETELQNSKNVSIERQYDKSPHSMDVPDFDHDKSHKSTPTATAFTPAKGQLSSEKSSVTEDDMCTPQQLEETPRGPLRHSETNSLDRKRTNTITSDVESNTETQRVSNSYLWTSDGPNKCSDTFLDDVNGIPDAC